MVNAEKGTDLQCNQSKKIKRPNSIQPHTYLRVRTLDMGEGANFFLKAYMGKDPAFLFYSSDFLVGTTFFTSEEVGDYIRILCHMHHMGGHMGSQDLRHIAPNISDKVLKKFKISQEGLYYNDRLLTEMHKRKAFTESRLKNLRSGHMASHMDSHMENENENTNKDINISRNIVLKGGMGEKPELKDIEVYFSELGRVDEADKFYDHFSSNGWKVGGKAAMKDWKAAARNWCRNGKRFGGTQVAIKQEKKPNTECEGCSGIGTLPDGKKCWCWK